LGGGPAPAQSVAKKGAGKGDLNSLLKAASGSKTLQKDGGAVGVKMQDFDPKKMARGSVRFLGSFDEDPPKIGLPEVAFVGRSNVGKSSLLNCLTNSKIAVTSKTPGRTQRVNIFAWKESKKAGRVVGMVDLPGFGFAKINKGVKDRISDQLGRYLADRDALKLVVVLVDLRLGMQKADLDAMELLYSLDIPFIVAGTKADKLSNNELDTNLSRLEAELGLEEGQLIACSSVSGEGRDFLWKQIMFGLFADDIKDGDDGELANSGDAEEDGGEDPVLVGFV
jgi:GTP-binding protein